MTYGRVAFIVIFALTSASCTIAGSDFAKPVEKLETAALAFGEVRRVSPSRKEIDESLLLRLYSVPDTEMSCFVETHGTCSFHYLLSVSSFDEHPEFGVFPLPFSGEIESVTWIESAVDEAMLEFTVRRYTAAAVTNNATLGQAVTTHRFRVTPKGLEALP